MVIIVNFWVYGSPSFLSDFNGVAGVFQAAQVPVVQSATITASVTYPLLNTLDASTVKLYRGFPERYTDQFPTGLNNCYSVGEDLSDFVKAREDFQELEDRYYPDIWVGGAWNVATGEPIGGVGSPWFTYPGDLLALMPGGILDDIVLMAGQAKRKFV